MRRLLLMLLGAASALAQPVTIGFKGGVPLSDFFSAPGQNAYGLTFDFGENFNRYALGPTIEVRLPRGFAIEADAIFRHLNYNGKVLQFGQWGPNYQTQGLTGSEFEFPLLAKYRFPSSFWYRHRASNRIQPFVDAGCTWNILRSMKGSGIMEGIYPDLASTAANSAAGFVMGAGASVAIGVFHLAPEIRYTHWGSANYLDQLNLVRSSQSQAEFLLGITVPTGPPKR